MQIKGYKEIVNHLSSAVKDAPPDEEKRCYWCGERLNRCGCDLEVSDQ